MLHNHLIKPEPPSQPFVAVRASLIEISRLPGVVLCLLGDPQQLAVVDPDTALNPLLHFRTQHDTGHFRTWDEENGGDQL